MTEYETAMLKIQGRIATALDKLSQAIDGFIAQRSTPPPPPTAEEQAAIDEELALQAEMRRLQKARYDSGLPEIEQANAIASKVKTLAEHVTAGYLAIEDVPERIRLRVAQVANVSSGEISR